MERSLLAFGALIRYFLVLPYQFIVLSAYCCLLFIQTQAERYNKEGLYFDHDHVMWGAQIGKGVYTSPSRDEYEKLAAPDAWYVTCINTAFMTVC